MTRLLVSVRNAEEAAVTIAAGAGLIDFKDPEAGALGMLDPAAIRDGLAVIGGRCPTSATTGDLPADPVLVCAAARTVAATGVDYVKVGLWPGERRGETVARLGRELAGRTRLVGVLLADADPDPGLVALMAEAGFAGAMLDVAAKGRSLPDLVERAQLGAFIRSCRRHDLLSGLAGSLRIAHLPGLTTLGPDVIGLRGGLCQGFDRRRPLDPNNVAEAVRMLGSSSRRTRPSRPFPVRGPVSSRDDWR